MYSKFFSHPFSCRSPNRITYGDEVLVVVFDVPYPRPNESVEKRNGNLKNILFIAFIYLFIFYIPFQHCQICFFVFAKLIERAYYIIYVVHNRANSIQDPSPLRPNPYGTFAADVRTILYLRRTLPNKPGTKFNEKI